MAEAATQHESRVFLTTQEYACHHSFRVPNAFRFNPRGRWPTLQRVLFWLAKKLNTEAWEDRAEYRTVTVDTKDITEAICRNAAQAELVWQRKAKYVVMGPRAFSQLAEQGHSAGQFLRFPITVTVGKGRVFQPLGLEIVVVPWIEGFFVIPELSTAASQ